jgi:hypothetical protein
MRSEHELARASREELEATPNVGERRVELLRKRVR